MDAAAGWVTSKTRLLAAPCATTRTMNVSSAGCCEVCRVWSGGAPAAPSFRPQILCARWSLSTGWPPPRHVPLAGLAERH